MATAEEQVRARWNVHFARFDNLWMPPKFHIRIALPNDFDSSATPGFSVVRDTEAEAWEAALRFTNEHAEKIRQVREEVEGCRATQARLYMRVRNEIVDFDDYQAFIRDLSL